MNLKRLFLVLVAVAVPGCKSVQLPAPEVQSGVRVQVTGLMRNAYTWDVMGIEGTATNQSGHDLQSCMINFDVLNDRGEKVSDAMAVTAGLKRDAVWRFQAVFLSPFSNVFQRIELRRVDAR